MINIAKAREVYIGAGVLYLSKLKKRCSPSRKRLLFLTNVCHTENSNSWATVETKILLYIKRCIYTAARIKQ